MANRRRTQWIDAIDATGFSIAGAAAPGTIVSNLLVGEAEMENVGGGATLLRVIGDIWTRRSAGTAPTVTHTLFMNQAFAGAVDVVDWNNDAFQRPQMLGTWMYVPGTDVLIVRERVDIRTKRKLMQGNRLTLEFQNHALAGENVFVSFHLRMLLLLP